MILRSALLYAGLALGANAALAETPDLDALKVGEMARLAVHAEPKAVPGASFTSPEGGAHSLADWQGKVVLLNFWQVSCAPCREEMPALDALERDYGGADFAVVPVAFGYNRMPALTRFYDQHGIGSLPVFLDPDRDLSAPMGVMAAPMTMILDREGREIARFVGAADWAGPEARALIEALIAG